jgi:DUF1365 family protein
VIEPGLFVGWLRHRRFAPIPHAFRYPVFMPLLDVDRIPALMQASHLTACNRWSWASYHDRDHLGDPSRPLRERLAADAAAAGCVLPGGRILLLTNLRYLGYAFNPVSFYYCFDEGGALRTIAADVHNTFGGARTYWLDPAKPRAADSPRTFVAAARKTLDVSPFLPRDLQYEFAFTTPGQRLVAHIRARRGGRILLDATLSLARRPWTAPEIRRALVRHPWMTGAVIARIHWQALRLWAKGVPTC